MGHARLALPEEPVQDRSERTDGADDRRRESIAARSGARRGDAVPRLDPPLLRPIQLSTALLRPARGDTGAPGPPRPPAGLRRRRPHHAMGRRAAGAAEFRLADAGLL